MASKSEVGHAINIANLETLNSYNTALGIKYNPNNGNIRIDKMQVLHTRSYGEQGIVNAAIAPYSVAVDAREIIFAPLNKNLTKLKKAFQATEGVGPKEMEDLDTIIRLLKGERKPGDNKEKTPEELANQHSVSQLSYIKRNNNMDLLIALLENTPNYRPNEDEFKVATYRNWKLRMNDSTTQVNNTFITLNTARSNRNKTLYTNPDNLVDTANTSRNYSLSILETNSPEYKAIFRIKFQKPYGYK